MPNATPTKLLSQIAPGAQVVVRDEEWQVTRVTPTPDDGRRVDCIGRSPFVRDTLASFFTEVDEITPLRPEDTTLRFDDSPSFRRSRLYLEAVFRKTPVPATESGLTVAHHQLLDELEYQKKATHKALTALQPRLLIADAVGLGKTLEVGMILSELIRRGRGDRILVVTPRHILEQFQHELWTRFAIPLVRLDSEGIAKVRRKIPVNRNPFTYYKRVIISIDTLKNAGRYRHHLEGIHWDAVVIDECHNLVNKGTLNNQLARVLAPRTEALLLTSATPHNGDPKSFAELIRLLDPAAVADPEKIEPDDIKHLYVRRHKNHDEVAPELGSDWAARKPPNPILVDATEQENELFAELADTWVHPRDDQAPTSGKGRSLFPYTLLKSALSSHHALAQTVAERRKRVAASSSAADGALTAEQQVEDDALARLGDLAGQVDDDSSAKLQRLIAELKEIGVGPKSKTRVVIFSERIATLEWLAEVVPAQLKLKPEAVLSLHGGISDVKQMDVIEEFGQEQSKVRLLFTGDMASEGVNLHRQCHHMIHFDLPWSLITIEQRNGRIDRYGQRNEPDIRAFVLTPDHPTLTGDVQVFEKLLEREHHAHKVFGESGSLLGQHTAELEEEEIIRRLRSGVEADEVVPEEPAAAFDLMAMLTGGSAVTEVATAELPSLFQSDHAFAQEALAEVYEDPARELEVIKAPEDPLLLSFNPPRDLERRFDALPQSYLNEQKITERLRVTADAWVAEEQLKDARARTDSMWPQVGHLSPLHPMLAWLSDKVLVSVERNEAPVVVADVAEPTFAIQGVYSNRRGQAQLVEWLAVTALGDAKAVDLFPVLEQAGVASGIANPGQSAAVGEQVEAARSQVVAAVALARNELDRRRRLYDADLDDKLLAPASRLENWVKRSNEIAFQLDEGKRRTREKQVGEVKASTRELIDSFRTEGDPMLRVLAVLVPGGSR
jgi:superfamily II DNA or RNA helicase